MAWIDRGGLRIHYQVHGPAGGRIPVLLTHGFSASSEMWAANLSVLSADRPVLVWDLRGHGQSDAVDEASLYSHELSLADMAAVLEAAGVERAVIGGMSLGGYLSLAFHLRQPERVAALLLIDTGPGYKRDDDRAEWNAWVERTAVDLETRGLAALGSSPEVACAHHRSATGLPLAARGIMTQHDSSVIESLPGISVPTLVVVGAEDATFLKAADYMAARIPGARKVVIEGAGHAPNIDRPDVFNDAVLDFLAAM
jgi:pimeloyl-ACP methyl ester carboxylesterase